MPKLKSLENLKNIAVFKLNYWGYGTSTILLKSTCHKGARRLHNLTIAFNFIIFTSLFLNKLINADAYNKQTADRLSLFLSSPEIRDNFSNLFLHKESWKVVSTGNGTGTYPKKARHHRTY
jgi:hypothetical protein